MSFLCYDIYIAGAVLVYSGRGPSHLWELTAIPLIDYLSVIVLALIIGLIVRVTHWQRSPNAVIAQP